MTTKGSIAVYGRTGVGKTYDVCRCFRKGYVILSEPDGLRSVQTGLGFTPAHSQLVNLERPYEEALQILRGAVAKAKAQGCTAVILDTGSELADRVLDANLVRTKNDPRRSYPETSRQIKRIIREILQLDLWAVAIFHEQGPKERYPLGGPKLPGSLINDIPPMFSLMLRANIVPGQEGQMRVYECDLLSDEYVMKDRYNVTKEMQPMDLLAIMKKVASKG